MEGLNVKHTAGPWETSFYGETTNTPTGDWDVIGPGGDMICDLKGCDNAEANAHLIASAPELLEALKELSWQVVKNGCNVNAPIELINSVTIAQRVIDKAEGRV